MVDLCTILSCDTSSLTKVLVMSTSSLELELAYGKTIKDFDVLVCNFVPSTRGFLFSHLNIIP